MAKVFISYDREDSDFAELVEGRLSKAGHDACMDVEILDAGDAWQDDLNEAIRGADIMVVIMTPDARASDYVAFEWAFALGAGIRVIPVELEPTDFHPRLNLLQRLDFTDKQRPWASLLEEIEKAAEAQQVTTVFVPADSPPTIKRAVAALDSLDVGEQVAGIQSLAATEHPVARDALARALQHPVKSVRTAAAIEFPDRYEPKLIPALIEIPGNRSFMRQWYPRLESYRVGDHIAQFDSVATPHLIKALQHGDSDVRHLSARVLGLMSENRAMASLTAALQDENAGVRQTTAWALGRIGQKEAAPELVRALGDEVDTVRAAAAKALGRIGHDDAVGLMDTLKDESELVRAAAAEALGELKAHPAVPDLLNLLQNDCAKVRAASALALGRIGDRSALPHLVQAFQDRTVSHGFCRRAAAQALGGLGGQDATDALCTYLAERQRQDEWKTNSLDFDVVEALLKLRCSHAMALIGKTLGTYGSMPGATIFELLGSYGRESVPALIESLNHPSKSVQEPAVKLLRQIGTEEALAAVALWNRSH